MFPLSGTRTTPERQVDSFGNLGLKPVFILSLDTIPFSSIIRPGKGVCSPHSGKLNMSYWVGVLYVWVVTAVLLFSAWAINKKTEPPIRIILFVLWGFAAVGIFILTFFLFHKYA